MPEVQYFTVRVVTAEELTDRRRDAIARDINNMASLSFEKDDQVLKQYPLDPVAHAHDGYHGTCRRCARQAEDGIDPDDYSA